MEMRVVKLLSDIDERTKISEEAMKEMVLLMKEQNEFIKQLLEYNEEFRRKLESFTPVNN